MLNKARLSFLMMIIFLLAIAACSPPNAGAPADSAAPSESASQEGSGAGGDITIAYLAGFTGDYAPWIQEEVKGAQLAIEEINAAGGVLDGRKLRLVTEDNESTVEGTIKGFNKLANSKVTAIVGPESDGIMAILKDASNFGIPVIANAAGTPSLDRLGGNFVYRVAPSDSLNGKIAAEILFEQGHQEVAIMIENVESAQTTADTFEKSFVEMGGKIMAKVPFNPGQNSYQAELKKVAEANPPVVYAFGGITAGTVIFKQWYQQGYKWEWYISGDMVADDMFKAIGNEVSEGMKSVVGTQDRSTPTFRAFADKFKQKFGAEPSPGMFTANSYDAVMLLALAIQAAGDPSGKAINAKLREVSGPEGTEVTSYAQGIEELKKGGKINYVGASGPVDFNEYGNVSAAFVLLEVKNGKTEQVKIYVPEVQ